MQVSALLTGVLSSFFFVFLNVAMNIYTKWLFDKSNFPLPWTMLAVQQLQSFIVLHPGVAWMKRHGWDKPLAQQRANTDGEDNDRLGMMHLAQVCAVTVLFCLNVGLNSLSLVQISITLNQTVRAFLPVGVLVLAACLEQRAYPSHSYVTTFVLVIGIALTCWGNPGFQLQGFLLAFTSTLVAAIGTSLNGRLLSNGPFSKSGPYGVARLIMIQSVPAFVIFSVFAFFCEGAAVLEKFQPENPDEVRWQWYQLVGLVSISSGLALLSNLGRCFLVAATSALMETLAGNAKVAALCVIDHYMFLTEMNALNCTGIAMTFLGFSVHILLQYASKDPEPASSPRHETRTSSVRFESTEAGDDRPSTLGRLRRNLNRPRLISAAETGLAAEHVAVQLGRDTTQCRNGLGEINGHVNGHGTNGYSKNGIPALPRPRSVTWPENARTERSGIWASVDFSLVLELPHWLGGGGPHGNSEDYSPLSVTSFSPMARLSAVSPAMPLGGMSPVASSARSRFFTDPTDANNKRSRLLDDVRQGPQQHHLQSVAEEQVDYEPSGLALDYL